MLSNVARLLTVLFTFLFPYAPSSFAATPENLMILEVRKGDTLFDMLDSADISNKDSSSAINSLKKKYNPGHLKVGQKISISFDINENKELILSSLLIKLSSVKNIKLSRNDAGLFDYAEEILPTTKILIHAKGVINYALFAALTKANVPDGIRDKFVKNYSYDVDFQREIRKGDIFEVIYEQIKTADGEIVGAGEIVYSALKLKKKLLSSYRYTTLDGRVDYYDRNGHSIKKSFLRTPIDGGRITSGYGKRRHPILGYNKVHKGLDFGASKGSPIYAAGGGVVLDARRKGGYGKYVKIRHSGGYATAYAHLNAYARRVKRGRKISQGQVIGYVGSTGRSTGPHLHYEVLRNGRNINPLSVKASSVRKLKSLELGIFYEYIDRVRIHYNL